MVDYVLVSPQLRGTFFFGKITIALYWLIQMFLLGGPSLAFRYLKYARSRHTLQRDSSTPTLLLGRGSDIEVILRAIEAGTVKKIAAQGHPVVPRRRSRPVDPRRAGARHLRRSRSGRAGFPRARRADPPPAWRRRARWRRRPIPDMLLARARRLGLPLVRVTSLGEGMRDAELAPLEIEDLLLRPTVQIDRTRLENFIRGKRVLVTGGGGSIGSEICTRVVAFGASRPPGPGELRAVPAPDSRKPDDAVERHARWTARSPMCATGSGCAR